MPNPVVEKIAGLVRELPALPAVAQQALALLSDPTTEPEALQEVFSRDAALALKLLRLANSAYYRRSREVTTLSAAVVLLGFKTIQTLVLSSAVYRVLSAAGPSALQLWEHSFAVAAGCRELAKEMGEGGSAREEAFLAGLFHDVGKGVIAAKFPGVYGQPLGVSGELETLGFHHGHLAQVLLARWEIPGPLAAAVGSHHECDAPGLAGLVALGDWLAWEVAPGLGAAFPAEPGTLVQWAGLSQDRMDGLRATVEKYLAEERGSHEAS